MAGSKGDVSRDRPALFLMAALLVAVASAEAVLVFGIARDASGAQILDGHDRRLVAALILGSFLQVAGVVCIWRFIVGPGEARRRILEHDLRLARDEIESSFSENPDGVAVYDRDGRIVRINRARAELAGLPPAAILGRHFTEVIAAEGVERARATFARALAGETVRGEARIVKGDGSAVDVAIKMFPRRLHGVSVGVNVVTRDQSELRAAEAANAEQVRRLSDLFDVAASYGRSTHDLLTSAISIITTRLAYDYGVVTEIVRDRDTVVALCGAPDGIEIGTTQPLRSSLARLSVASPDVYEALDFRATPYARTSEVSTDWRSVAGMKIVLAGRLYGTVGFASRTVRTEPLTRGDVIFMRLACTLVGTIIERARHIEHLDVLACSDPLTGLPNRAGFAKRLADIEASERFAVHYVDLDHFKSVNDRFGHGVGDAVLRAAAERLRGCGRPTDVVVRLGGDEFAILQRGPVSREQALAFARRIVERFSTPIALEGRQHPVGASVGVALRPEHGGPVEAVIEAADAALLRAKRAGRRCIAFADDDSARAAYT